MPLRNTRETQPAVRYSILDSPIGSLLLTGDEAGAVTGLWFDGLPLAGWQRDDGALAAASDQLEAYFAGELREFDLPLAPAGTEWQRKVWDALMDVPYGTT